MPENKLYKLIASDIDDTILALDGSLPEANRRALQALHNNGVTVVFSSGRASASIRPVASRIMELTDNKYLIAFNGGRIVSALSETLLFENSLETPLIAEIMEEARRAKLHVQAYTDKGFILERGEAVKPALAERYAKETQLSFHYVDDLAAALPQGSVKLLVVGEHEYLLEQRDRLLAMANKRFSVMFSKPHYLEIVGAGVNKGNALTFLAKHLGISLEHCLAIGDSSNDIEMIQAAGLGIAVANARDDLKAVADSILERNCNEAVMIELMERYFPEIDVTY